MLIIKINVNNNLQYTAGETDNWFYTNNKSSVLQQNVLTWDIY